jgi:Protein of unknown function (DUF2939)
MIKKLMSGVVVLALLFIAWPLFSAWQLHRAVKTRDIAALETRVDWTTLRANLKPRVSQALQDSAADGNGIAGSVVGAFKRAISGVVADKSIDLLVTPQTLSRLLAGREFVAAKLKKDPKEVPPAAPPKAASPDDEEIEGEDPEDPMPPRRIRWAFFESVDRFRIESVHPRLKGGRMVAILGQQGLGWKLIDISVK